MTTTTCTTVEEVPTATVVPTSLTASFPVKFLDTLLSGNMQPFGHQPSSGTGSPGEGASGMRYQAQQTMHQMTGQMQGGLERMRDWLQNWIQNAADTLRVYVNQYPPLAAFLFTLLVLSAVPVSVYVIFGLVTSVIFLTIALIGFSFVEGFILLTSGGIFMAILGGIALFTTIGFAMVSAVYTSYRGGYFLASNLWQAGGQFSGQVREAAQRVGQSMPGQQSMSGQQSMPGQQSTSGQQPTSGQQSSYSSAPGGFSSSGLAGGTSSG